MSHKPRFVKKRVDPELDAARAKLIRLLMDHNDKWFMGIDFATIDTPFHFERLDSHTDVLKHYIDDLKSKVVFPSVTYLPPDLYREIANKFGTKGIVLDVPRAYIPLIVTPTSLCTVCNGSGYLPYSDLTCTSCNGRGIT